LLRDEIALLRARLERFTQAHDALAEVVTGELKPGLSALTQDHLQAHRQVRSQLDEITRARTPPAARPVHWAALSAGEAAQQWPILADWISDVFVPSYEVTRAELPDCWALHPPAVIELSWLHSAHVEAYLPGSPPALAGEWHCRWRPTVLERMTMIIPVTLCRPGEHLLTEQGARGAIGPPRRLEPWETGHPNRDQSVAAAQQRAKRGHWHRFYEQAV
jgi:hypothetical protein